MNFLRGLFATTTKPLQRRLDLSVSTHVEMRSCKMKLVLGTLV